MNIPTVIKVLGHFLIFLAFILLIPSSLAYFDQVDDYKAFLIAALTTFITGCIFYFFTRKTKMTFSSKEGFAIVTFGWILLSFFGCLPYVLTPLEHQISFTDAYFETMSGFTTTGATILNDIESLPRGLLLWRNLTQWIGGMGVIVLFLAILPAMGAGGFQLFRAEIPGPSKDKLSPKIANTAKTLWSIYLLLTLFCFLSLFTVGMNWFDALCHTFGTIATGGFSPRNDSIASFQSWEIDCVIIFYMFLSGCNFILFFHFIKGNFKFIYRNEELRLYIALILFGTIMITYMVWSQSQGTPFPKVLLDALFQVVCIITSTGYITADYDAWPLLCQFFILLLMLTGACAGSTSGGMKVFRVLVSLKVAKREISQLLHPRATIPLKVDGENISEPLTRVILGFISIFILLLGLFAFLVIFIEGDRYDLTSLFSICISCLSNIGPALDSFGPTDNYRGLTDTTKWLLAFLMLMGRLELYSVLVIFNRNIWKK